MLTFTCRTCQNSYPVEMPIPSQLIYTIENRRIQIKEVDQDCEPCENEISQESSKIRDEARARVRARKITDVPTS